MKIRFLVHAAIVVMALSAAGLAVPVPAQAEDSVTEHWIDYGEDEGDWVEVWIDSNDNYAVLVYEDYEFVEALSGKLDRGNPDPVNGGEDPVDHALLLDQLRKAGADINLIPEFSRTPLGKLLTSRGLTLDTRHNPAETGVVDDGLGGGGGFTPGNGSPVDQIRKQAKRGNNKGGDGSDGDDLKPEDAGLFDDDMPGPPELINPNPVLREDSHPGHGAGNGGGGNGGGAGNGAAGGAAAGRG